jgi:hypothetical protein
MISRMVISFEITHFLPFENVGGGGKWESNPTPAQHSTRETAFLSVTVEGFRYIFTLMMIRVAVSLG